MKQDSQLVKRIKSLAWRAGMMALAVFITVIADNAASLELHPTVTVILGLVLGEISKFLNQTKSV